MITIDNFMQVLALLGFEKQGNIYCKTYQNNAQKSLYTLKVDTQNKRFLYEEIGITLGDNTTSNFEKDENFVVFECVCRLLEKGYLPCDLELEPRWKLGHESKASGKADIWVRKIKSTGEVSSLLIIECKTQGEEFQKEWQNMQQDGGQLFSYLQQQEETKFLCLYESDLVEDRENNTCKIKHFYHLFDMQDNENHIKKLERQNKDKHIKRYSECKSVIMRFNAWSDTYNKTFETAGLFESDIPPYAIGKTKYTKADLIEVDANEIKKKYNEYALILRQYNVGTGENAFDKLVNLFLAKIVDENSTKDELDFYWKGEVRDDDYSLQDRLQRLYKEGMEEHLGETITYVSQKDIDLTFEKFRNDKDAIKEQVEKYFTALKYYSNNEFAFISVHNEDLFRKNAIILRKVVLMLQDIKLCSNKNNQFLGDLFEGFLQKGVKQDEGQFFTPMPIVRFIVSSLPLESMLENNHKLKCIDYACGAAHFLTEYASQMKTIVEKGNFPIPFCDICANITGIEKQDRLSKVSKVSAFMYGYNDIKILCQDALKQTKQAKCNFDVLITNPPFSVKGFLEGLNNTDKSSYSLFEAVSDIAKNNAIEAFFLERASQILRAGAVAAIILPVSVLNKNGIYMKAREVLLKNFCIVSIVKFAQGTFGKTGTNVAAFFLKRKELIVPDSLHYEYRIYNWFRKIQNDYTNALYGDREFLIGEYCKIAGFDVDDYLAFSQEDFTQNFLQHPRIKLYTQAFFSNASLTNVCQKAKEIRQSFSKKSTTVKYKNLPDLERKRQETKALHDFITEIEKEKLYYFILSFTQETKVLIVESPQKTQEIKAFLGYEWSNRNGQEGIHYLNTKAQKQSEKEGEAEDDTIQEITNILGINTPLFDPKDFENKEKINAMIKANYNKSLTCVPESLAPYAKLCYLHELLDFSSISFNKEIKTQQAKGQQQAFTTRHKTVRLGDVAEIEYGTRIVKNNTTGDTYPVYGGGGETFRTNTYNRENRYIISRFGMSPSCVRFVKGKFFLNDSGLTVKSLSKELLSNYLDIYLYNIQEKIYMLGRGNAQKNMNVSELKSLQIPLPPLCEQEKIVGECEVQDRLEKEASLDERECRSRLEMLFNTVEGEKARLGDIAEIETGTRPAGGVGSLTDGAYSLGGEHIDNNSGHLNLSSPKYVPISFYESATRGKVKENDFLICKDGALTGKVALVRDELKDKKAMINEHVFILRCNNVITQKYLFIFFYSSVGQALLKQNITGSAQGGLNSTNLKNISIPIPPLCVQEELVAKASKIEANIKENQSIIENTKAKKQQILKYYL